MNPGARVFDVERDREALTAPEEREEGHHLPFITIASAYHASLGLYKAHISPCLFASTAKVTSSPTPAKAEDMRIN